MPTVEERVADGVEWLDAQEPGWAERINLAELDLASPCRCVLGQIYGGFDEAPVDDISPQLFGFNANLFGTEFANLDEEFTALEVEWRRVITSRREAAA
jgi:hypothetical protein